MKKLIVIIGLFFVCLSVESQNITEKGGNVGIGTTNPTAKLDVNGVVKSTSEIQSVSVNPGFLFNESDVNDKNWHYRFNSIWQNNSF